MKIVWLQELFCWLLYDTVNHRLLIQKLYNTTQDSALCRVIQNMLSNRRFYAELNKERSRWRLQKNGLPQGSVILSPILFNIYTNDQPILNGTRSFIYTDDLCITSQYSTIPEIEDTLEEALGELTEYYRENSQRANPDKTSTERTSKEKSESSFECSGTGEDYSPEVPWRNTGQNTQLQTSHTEQRTTCTSTGH